MIQRLKELPLRNKIILVITSFLIFLIIPVTAVIFLKGKTAAPTPKVDPIKFEYCGADPEELCILSFGRDGTGNALINFFVPNKKFPNFYLIIKKRGVESLYKCKRNKEIKTSVLCSGAPLSLNQTVEINLFSNNQLLATGTFLIEAFLVSTQESQFTPEAVISDDPSATISFTRTPTEEIFATESATADPESSATASPEASAYPYP